MEQNLIVRGIAFEDQITRVTVFGLPGSLGTLSTIFTTLAENRINVDIIIQSITEQDRMNLSFSIHHEDREAVLDVLDQNKENLQFDRVETESGLAKVSIVGSGMVSNPGVAADMFAVLAGAGIQVKMVSTSEIKVSTVISDREMVRAVEALHTAFDLDSREPAAAFRNV